MNSRMTSSGTLVNKQDFNGIRWSCYTAEYQGAGAKRKDSKDYLRPEQEEVHRGAHLRGHKALQESFRNK